MSKNNMTFTASMRLRSAEFKKGVQEIQRSLGALKNSFLGVAGALGAGLGLTKLISNLKDTAVQLSVAKNTLENVSYETKTYTDGVEKLSMQISNYGDNLEFVTKLSKDYKQDLVALIQNFAQFHAACQNTNISLDQQKEIFNALTRAAAFYHMSADRTKDMMNAVVQMVSKGKIAAEELRRQLGNALPGAFNLMASSLGYTTMQLDDMMRKGQVMADDALPKFARALNNVTKNINVDSLQMSMNELRNTWYSFVEGTGAENALKKIIEDAARALAWLTENFEHLKKGFIAFATTLAGINLFKHAINSGRQWATEQVANYEKVMAAQKKLEASFAQMNGKAAKAKQFPPIMYTNYGQAYGNVGITKEQAQDIVNYNKNLLRANELSRRISGTRLLTDVQIDSVKKYNKELTKTFQLGKKESIGFWTSVRNFGLATIAAIKTALLSLGITALISLVIGAITTMISKQRELKSQLREINNLTNEYRRDVEAAKNSLTDEQWIMQKNLGILQSENAGYQQRLGALREINRTLGLTGDKAFGTDALDKTKNAYKDIVAQAEKWLSVSKKQAEMQIQLQKRADAESKIAGLQNDIAILTSERNSIRHGAGRDDYGNTVYAWDIGKGARGREIEKEIALKQKQINVLKGIAKEADNAADLANQALLTILNPEIKPTGGDGKAEDINKIFKKYNESVKEYKNQLDQGALTKKEHDDAMDKLNISTFKKAAGTGALDINKILEKVDKKQALTAMEKWYKEVYEASQKAGAKIILALLNDAMEKSIEEAIEEAEKKLQEEMDDMLKDYDDILAKETNALMEHKPSRGRRDETFDYKKKSSDILSEDYNLSEDLVQQYSTLIEKYSAFESKSEIIKKLLGEWREELRKVAVEASDLETKLKIAKIREDIDEMNKEMNKLAYSSVKNLATSMDRVVKGMESLNKVMEDSDSTGWEKFTALFNEAVQIIDSVYGLVTALKEMSTLAATISGGNAALILLENEAYREQIELLATINRLKGISIDETTAEVLADIAATKAAEAKASAEASDAVAGATKSGAGLPFPYNLAAIAAGVGLVMAMLANMSKFAEGGYVGGNSYSGDKQLARVNSGELILNATQQRNLLNLANGKGGAGGGQVEFKIRGSELVGVLKNYGRVVK